MARLGVSIVSVLPAFTAVLVIGALSIVWGVAGGLAGLVVLGAWHLAVPALRARRNPEPGPGADTRWSLREHLVEIADRFDVEIETRDGRAWELVLPARGIFTSTVEVSFDRFVWWISVRRVRTGTALWGEGAAHYGQSELDLVAEQVGCIEAYVALWCSAETVHPIIPSLQIKGGPSYKWRHDGEWSAVSIP